MSGVYILLLIFASFEVFCCARILKVAPDVKADDDGLRDLILFHLKRGYNISNDAIPCHYSQLSKKYIEDCEFSLQFYMNAVKCCSITNLSNRVLPTGDVICFDDGHCIDIGDPGIHPQLEN